MGLWQLLDGGDWACAHGDAEALARIAESLERDLSPPFCVQARRIRELATSDIRNASVKWGRLAATLRATG